MPSQMSTQANMSQTTLVQSRSNASIVESEAERVARLNAELDEQAQLFKRRYGMGGITLEGQPLKPAMKNRPTTSSIRSFFGFATSKSRANPKEESKEESSDSATLTDKREERKDFDKAFNDAAYRYGFGSSAVPKLPKMEKDIKRQDEKKQARSKREEGKDFDKAFNDAAYRYGFGSSAIPKLPNMEKHIQRQDERKKQKQMKKAQTAKNFQPPFEFPVSISKDLANSLEKVFKGK